MRKTIAIMFGISVIAGASYLVWIYCGIGKSVLSKWLLKRWKQMADRKNTTVDVSKLQTELNKLEYEDIELLFRLTIKDPMAKSKGGTLDAGTEKWVKEVMKKFTDRKISKRADLTSLNNISLFGT